MKALITAPFSQESVERLSKYVEVELDGWGITQEEMSKEELLKRIEDVDIFISEMEFADKEVIDAGKNLKVIGSVRGTPFNIDSAYAKQKGIISIFAPGRNAIGVSELTIFLMGELIRKITTAHQYAKDGNWTEESEMSYVMFRGTELNNKKLGLVGLGAIGLKVAKIAQAFGMQVQCYDPYLKPGVGKELNISAMDLDELFRTSDFISIHCKVTPETTGMIGYDLLSQMKPTAYFINTARSKITKEEDIIRILSEQKIAGAALDVFDKEPIGTDHPLLKLDNCYVVPHIGGATNEVVEHHSRIVTDDIIRFVNGDKPIHIL